jgi:hypothetical protein
MQEQLPRDVFKEPTGMYNGVSWEEPPASGESQKNPVRPVPIDRRDTCTCPLRLATSTSL